ncbi:intracellular hyaluronan-binding protein 4.S [Drosophila montana]|uniref:intracellular hyaluronan-binding protein 4.S n=1 Tax=Drosophila montana TaxID=40370 RepID=UPI00313CADA0
MENSGNNRYELLFMDDEVVAAPILLESNEETGKKKTDHIAKQNINKNEKENKLNILNKNNSHAKIANVNSMSKPNGVRSISNAINEARTRNNRNNGLETNHSNVPEYNSDFPQRQIKDRDSKAPRYRINEKLGKREFDRQSGSDKTGIKSIDKRDGAGAHNWGSAKQDIEDLKTGAVAPITEKEDSANEQCNDLINNLEEDESKQMTLDEWKALKDQRAKPNYNLRKAGEGVDNSEWKKMTVLSKKKGLHIEDELEYDPSMYPQRVGRLQRIVDIQFNFNDGRKSGFRKGPRAPAGVDRRQETMSSNGLEKIASHKFGEKFRSGSKTFRVNDEMQFPTLS